MRRGSNYNLEKRKFVVIAMTLFIVVAYIMRLFFLQIMSDEYKQHADSNAFQNRVLYPTRGAISDRNGNVLVYNQPAYDVMVVMSEIKNLDTLDLCNALNISKEFFIR